MSLIFKALQRFDSPEATPGEDQPELPPKRNASTLRRLLLSPSLALCAAAAIFLVGLAVSQVLHYFPKKIDPLTPTVQAAVPDQKTAPGQVPNEPVHYEMEAAPDAAMPGDTEGTEMVRFQVHPPEHHPTSTTNAPASSSEVRFQTVAYDGGVKEGGDSPQSGVSIPTAVPTVGAKENKVAFFPPSHIENENAASTGNVQPEKVLSFVRREPASPKALSNFSPRVEESPPSTLTSPRSSKEDLQRQRQSDQATKHLKVSQLATRIHSAIQADDVALTSQLLAQLTRMIGAQNSFVLKLRAFSLIRQNQLDEARTLLSSVLSQSADDLDAGLNMAVIDMKTGRLSSARKRLVKLQEMFPEDANITTYLRKLSY